MTEEKGLTIRPENLPARFRANLVPQETERALMLVRQGFDPGMHLVLYQGRVTVTIDGLYWWARGGGSQFRVVSEPVTGKDFREAYGVKDGEIGVIAKIYLQGETVPLCTGFGRASTDPARPVSKGSAVEAQHPYRMAEKRAEAQALRKLRPLGVAVQTVEEAAEGPEPEVDTSTGEIIEGASRRVEPDPFDDPPPADDGPMPVAAAVGSKPAPPASEAEWATSPASDAQKQALLNAGTKAGLTREQVTQNVQAAILATGGVLQAGTAQRMEKAWKEIAAKAKAGQPQ